MNQSFYYKVSHCYSYLVFVVFVLVRKKIEKREEKKKV